MNPDIKAQWTDALRSGRYQQGFRFYKSLNRFCTLGVLLNELQPKGWTEYYTGKFFNHKNGNEDYFTNGLGIPEEKLWELFDMDLRYVTFAETADWIDANF